MDRRLRLCDVCGQLDDHPRHTVNYPADSTEGTPPPDLVVAATDIPAAALVEFAKPTVSVRHIDCCAAAGCPAEGDDRCEVKDREYGQRRGQELIDHLEELRSANG